MAKIRGGARSRPTIDYLARDYDSILAAMRAAIPDKLPEWTDNASEADFGNVLLELFAHMGDILSYYQDRVANESFLSTARTRRSVIEHLRLIGYSLATAAPAAAVLEVNLPGDHTGQVIIKRGDAFATSSTRDRPSVRFEYNGAGPLTVDLDALPVDPVTQRKSFDLSVEEGRLISNEVLGVSDGTADQRLRLHHSPLILRSRGAAGSADQDIVLLTRNGTTTTPWIPRESLAFSHGTPNSANTQEGQFDYVIEIDDEDLAVIGFGDGLTGAIPETGAQIIATYRVGGGAVGNIGPGQITTIVAAPELANLGARVTNRMPAANGSDREDIDRAVQHAPAVFRSLNRAVTAADYEALALDFRGVGKVRAVATNWNTVTLFVAPTGGGLVSDVLRAGLLAHFEDRRPISTRVQIAQVAYVDIYVTAEIGVLPYYARVDVVSRVRSAAAAVLAFDDVDFGSPMFLSHFYEVIEGVEGVLFANIVEFRRADTPPAPANPTIRVATSGVITNGPNEIPRAPTDKGYDGGISVVATGGF